MDTYTKHHKRLSRPNFNCLLPKRIRDLLPPLSETDCALALKPIRSPGSQESSGIAWQRSQIRGSDPALVISQLFVLCFYGLLPYQGISLFSSQTLSVSLHRYLIDPLRLQLVSSIMRNAKEVVAKASRLARNSSGRVPALNKSFSF